MKNENTVLYQLTETSKFMMSFVIVTKEDNAIVIDGGRPEDMPLLKKYVGGRHIAAWILTHAHSDHISGFIDEWQKNEAREFDIGAIYYHFPDYTPERTDVHCPAFYQSEFEDSLCDYLSVLPKFKDRAHVVSQGDTLTIDEIKIEFLFSWHKELTTNLMNDSSLVFKVNAPNKSVLFLGDIGPEGGDLLFWESRDKLKADIVQMAHHGHMDCGMNVYAAIAPEACLWCCPDWLYDECEVPPYLNKEKQLWRYGNVRMYGTAVTRRYMEILGVKTHYVTAHGTNEILL